MESGESAGRGATIRPSALSTHDRREVPTSLAAGTRLGPYEILAAIGAGGTGDVYEARDARLDLIVAIKVLPPAFAADPAECHRGWLLEVS